MVKNGFKYFISYKDWLEKKVRPLYKRDFDETKYISLLGKNEELLKKYNKIWDKSAILLKKDLIVKLFTLKISKN